MQINNEAQKLAQTNKPLEHDVNDRKSTIAASIGNTTDATVCLGQHQSSETKGEKPEIINRL